MPKKMINQSHVEGLLYEHNLQLKESGPKSKNPGTEFINGSISIATDDECLNVISVYFTYVTELTKNKKTNPTFNVLKNILEGKSCSVMEHGKENAVMLRCDSAIALNDWFDKDDNLITQRRNEGGFVHLATDLASDENERATFKTDIVITNCSRKEANEERKIPEKVVVKGAIFNFRGNLLPVEFSAVAPEAMNYFESLDASSSNPVFTQVWGRQVSKTVVRIITEESAFGKPHVREVKNSYKDFEITGARSEQYDWDDESTITAAEMKEAMSNREIYLAEVKTRQEEYQKERDNAIPDTSKANPKEDEYNF